MRTRKLLRDLTFGQKIERAEIGEVPRQIVSLVQSLYWCAQLERMKYEDWNDGWKGGHYEEMQAECWKSISKGIWDAYETGYGNGRFFRLLAAAIELFDKPDDPILYRVGEEIAFASVRGRPMPKSKDLAKELKVSEKTIDRAYKFFGVTRPKGPRGLRRK